jgi:hypothetical protein
MKNIIRKENYNKAKRVTVRFTSVPVLSKAVSLQNLTHSDAFDVKCLNLLL